MRLSSDEDRRYQSIAYRETNCKEAADVLQREKLIQKIASNNITADRAPDRPAIQKI